jgi:Purple acid Phosphatase, N-terminal domain
MMRLITLGGLHMNQMALILAIAVAVGSLLSSNPAAAQKRPHGDTFKGPYSPKPELPPAKTPAQVRITKGPELELARDDWAIIRWTSNNPGGTDEHFAVAHYGTDPKDLSMTAKSPIRLGRDRPEEIFRVRVPGLKPGTTYYYTVDSTWGNGKSDGVKSPVKRFTMPSDPRATRAATASQGAVR